MLLQPADNQHELIRYVTVATIRSQPAVPSCCSISGPPAYSALSSPSSACRLGAWARKAPSTGGLKIPLPGFHNGRRFARSPHQKLVVVPRASDNPYQQIKANRAARKQAKEEVVACFMSLGVSDAARHNFPGVSGISRWTMRVNSGLSCWAAFRQVHHKGGWDLDRQRLLAACLTALKLPDCRRLQRRRRGAICPLRGEAPLGAAQTRGWVGRMSVPVFLMDCTERTVQRSTPTSISVASAFTAGANGCNPSAFRRSDAI